MSEFHVASFIVQCWPEQRDTVRNTLSLMKDIEVHGENQQSKLIVTAEGPSHKAIADLTDEIRLLPGVVNIAAVYHEYMPAKEMKGNKNEARS